MSRDGIIGQPGSRREVSISGYFRLLALLAVLALVQPFIPLHGTQGSGFSAAIPVAQLPVSSTWQDRVDPAVLSAAADGETEFLVLLQVQADLSGASSLPTKREKGEYVYRRLVETARRTQPVVTAELDAIGVEYQPFWVTNLLWVRGDLAAVQALALRDDVSRIYANPSGQAQIPDGNPDLATAQVLTPQGIEWNILKVGAPQVWAEGFTGQGVVIGGQDTGYDWDHPALKTHYRGWDGVVAHHDYTWHDAIHQDDPHSLPGNPCGFDSPVPCDDQGHGTHTMGTMVGDDRAGNQVGMAPGARWIGCRNMEQGWGKPSTYLECYQWFLAPTDLENENPQPDLAPDVINNSWACPADEGCTDPFVLQQAVENLRKAGILSVHSAGNSGPSCGTVNTPAAIYDASFSVAATDSADQVANFSSRGPSAYTDLLKPDISAPGVSVRSSASGGGYLSLSGTSMAAPHVAGLVALLISAEPALRGQVDLIEQIIRESAVPRTSSQSCSGIPGSQVPNHTYGWGRIDAVAAYQQMRIGVSKTASAYILTPGSTLDYTLTVRNNNPLTDATNILVTDTLPQNTVFIGASHPYDQFGDTVQWYLPILGPGEIASFELNVSTPPDYIGTITNSQYAADSDHLTSPAIGQPVEVQVGYFLFFPYVPN